MIAFRHLAASTPPPKGRSDTALVAFGIVASSAFFAALSPPLSAQILVNTFAGGAVRSGVPAQNVWLDSVAGLAWGPGGTVVFSDTANHVIRRVRADGALETIAGTGVPGFSGDGGPAATALLNQPSPPHYDAAGNLYFLDTGNSRIRRIDSLGVVTTVAGDGIPFFTVMDATGPAAQRSLPSIAGDIQVDAAGDIYFLDTTGQFTTASQSFVRRITPIGQLQTFAVLPDCCYSGLAAIDAAGNLYTGMNNGLNYAAIVRIAPDATVSTIYRKTTTGQTSATLPGRHMTADAAGNLYFVANARFGGAIVRLNPDGSTTTVAGGGQPPDFGYVSSPDGPALPSVIYPAGLALDAQGQIVFADTFTPLVCCNSRTVIREVTAGGQLKTLAGANGQFVPDGTPLRDIWFTDLSSIAFSKPGDLYVAGHCSIHIIGRDGAFSTFAGTGNCAYPSPGATARNADIPPSGSIAVDSQNRVWLADAYLNLYNIAPDGTVSKVIRTPVIGGTGQIAIDSKDRVYVAGLDSLYRVLPDFTYQQLALPPRATVSAIGTDSSGAIYVAAASNIYTVNDDGALSLVYANQGVGANSLAVAPGQRIWLESYGPFSVITAAGTLVVGDARAVSPGDGGPVNSAGIRGPSFARNASLAFSPAGDLYFLDGSRIRRLTGIGNVAPAPSINPGGVVNAVSYAGGAIAPGEVVAIFGSNFGASTVTAATPENSFYPMAVGRTQVLFNGYPAPITAVGPNQINAIVPEFGSSATVESVQVQVDAALSPAVNLPVAVAVPGLSTLDMSGSGGAAALNQDGSINSPAHPAARGSIVSFYGTGMGAFYLPDGALTIATPYPVALAPVTVTIGGKPAPVQYAGAAPFLVNGVFQVNVQIPPDVPPGNPAVVLTVDGIASTRNVTVAVR